VRSCDRALKRPVTFSLCGAGSARRGRRDAAQCECSLRVRHAMCTADCAQTTFAYNSQPAPHTDCGRWWRACDAL
jgi:hypothetical protein